MDKSSAFDVALSIVLAGLMASGPAAPAWAQTRAAKAATTGEPSACMPREAISVRVADVIDGRTLALADGRQARLATIETPDPRARAALAELTSGRELALSLLAPSQDRYGRLNVRAFLADGGGSRSIEAEIVARGLAFVSPRSGEKPCTAMLLVAERRARAAKAGLWADPAYDIKLAQNFNAVLAARGQFAIVEGRVVSVRESGGTVYVNFGRRWSEDFTVTIPKRNERSFTSAGIEPKRLEGHTVRVRGWIEERGGPWIEASIPEQIEIADAP
jgi:endonuclease YncB( thermonuclease family)